MNEKMRAEGKKRIEVLQDMGLWDEVLKCWEQGTVCFSKPMEIMGEFTGVTFTLNEEEGFKELKEKLEAELGIGIYYGIYNETVFGRMISFLALSSSEEDWEMERDELCRGYADAYCYNLDEGCGEYGSIGFCVANGGLVRTE